MVLKTHRWGPADPASVVCIHGLTQDGGVFDGLGRRLATRGHSVVAVDLRGHGESGREPPWNVETHARDLLDTLDALGVERATWIGHSFGGRVVAAVASLAGELTMRIAMLDPGLQVPPTRALRSAEVERLDWSFATVDGAVEAVLSSEMTVAAPRDVVAEWVRKDVQRGSDGRFRFRFCPSAVVVAWSEMTLPPPPVAEFPTLIVRATVPLADGSAQIQRYREALGDLLTVVDVPNGHNMLWESPEQTIGAIDAFVPPDWAR
jgi:lipase